VVFEIMPTRRAPILGAGIQAMAKLSSTGPTRTQTSSIFVSAKVATDVGLTFCVGDRSLLGDLAFGERLPDALLPEQVSSSLGSIGCAAWFEGSEPARVADAIARTGAWRRMEWLLKLSGEPTHIKADSDGLRWESFGTPGLTPELAVEVARQLGDLSFDLRPTRLEGRKPHERTAMAIDPSHARACQSLPAT
jgi:hypothetical protein